ncbi:uncharacterized protein LOC109535883 [Dendroctonus ponderosae]|uniref:uncharacterized protein LOC109535883 n=1 Tax=Dendroctonus ponderosae TaxID=77166 RepID=UPI0020362B2E|nr:uncharacterized protein LOC109535883 [Dendroctonus ponderosae]
MGQCTSNKSKGSLSIKKILSHNKKPKKMDRHKHLKESKNEDYKVYPMDERSETSTLLDSNRQKPQKCTKGVAMSFGFKKRSPPVASNRPVAWEPEITEVSDPNGNRGVPNSAQKPRVATPKPSRSRLSQVRPNRPPDSPFPLHFSHRPSSRRTSPSPDGEVDLNRTFSRNITVVTRTEVAEISEVARRGETSEGAVMRTSGGQRVQPGKFTFQTTRLPQPEPIRVMETKTAKTIANNNTKSARMWRQYEETCSMKSSISSQTQHENARSSFELPPEKPSSGHEYLLPSVNERSLEISDNLSCSEAYTPPPLPELPSVFNIEKQDSTQKENERQDNRQHDGLDLNCAKKFLELSPFLKSSARHLLDRDSPQSSSDQEWINGGEAMADEVSLALSPKRKVEDPKKKPEAETHIVTQTILKPDCSLEMIDSLKDSMHLTLSEEDPKFAAVAISNNAAALLDDEILSPVESLLSSTGSDDLLKKNPEPSPSSSKEVNEKVSLSPPGSPSIATYSLSLSEDKEDFLIDDEIADQPELVFEECRSLDLGNMQQYIPDLVEKGSLSPVGRRRTSYSSDFSPLPVRNRREFLRSANQGSFESLSPCESICSEDLMMDYEASLINDVDNWDRESESFRSLEGTPRSKRKNHEQMFNNKNAFKSSTARPGNSLRRPFGRISSPECGGSPKRGYLNSLGVQSVTYDPACESLTLTRANHSAIQHDIIGLKTMLLTLRRVLSESEVQMPLTSSMENLPMACQNNNYSNEFRLELADLRRQVIFLQGQLDDKEKTVADLQKQIDHLAIGSTLDEPPLSELDNQTTCNAATQTERTRPTSSGIFSLTPSPIDDNNPILRFLVQ